MHTTYSLSFLTINCFPHSLHTTVIKSLYKSLISFDGIIIFSFLQTGQRPLSYSGSIRNFSLQFQHITGLYLKYIFLKIKNINFTISSSGSGISIFYLMFYFINIFLMKSPLFNKDKKEFIFNYLY